MEKQYVFKTRASGKTITVNCSLPENQNSGKNKYIMCDSEDFSFCIYGSMEIFEFYDIINFLKNDGDDNKIYEISCKESL